MDCRTYIEEYLSAHVDGELSAAELRAAEEHLAGCVNCRARFAEERAVKALLRERAELRRTPPTVRGSILAALDAIDQTDASSSGRDRAAGADRGGLRSIRRARVWVIHGNVQQAHAFSPFDVAIDNYKQFADHFEPNIKSTVPGDISDAYMEHALPGFVWNFQRVGYKLVGGRVDHLSDGTPVSYTFYRGQSGTILCTYMKSHGLQPPPGESQQPDEPSYTVEHHYYNYKGYNICLSYPRGGCICVLVTRCPMQEFVEAVMDSGP
jgi:hypothetical protein